MSEFARDSVDVLAQAALDALEKEDQPKVAQVYATLAQVKATEILRETMSLRLQDLA